MDVCTNNSKSYLVGDINVSSIDAVCNTIANRLFSIRWIGIAKQWFINFDRGQTISKEKQNIIELCKTCNQQECGMQQCNTTLQTEVLCIPIPTTNITKATTSSTTRSTTRSTTSSTTKQTATTKVTTSAATNVAINTTKDSHVNRNSNQQDSNEHSVLVGILVTVMVLIVGGVVIGIIILKRRQAKIPKNVRKAGLKNELPEIQQNKNYNESDNSMNNNYFVLESPKSNYEVLDDDIQESESPYTDGGEGTYDHLRDKESRRKTTDNVYQHAHCLQNKESSDYDFAGRAGNQEIENPYYDHANEHTRNSDYGYNTLDRS